MRVKRRERRGEEEGGDGGQNISPLTVVLVTNGGDKWVQKRNLWSHRASVAPYQTPSRKATAVTEKRKVVFNMIWRSEAIDRRAQRGGWRGARLGIGNPQNRRRRRRLAKLHGIKNSLALRRRRVWPIPQHEKIGSQLNPSDLLAYVPSSSFTNCHF